MNAPGPEVNVQDRGKSRSRDLLDHALEYAAAGLAVFPGHSITGDAQCTCGRPNCGSAGKHPRIKEWQLKASHDPGTIRDWWHRWPEANVCIATGRMSGVIVLDVDPRHGGFDSLRVLEAELGELPATPTARTGGGGVHYFFAHHGEDVPNRVDLLPGIDIRGDGGFVVAPPSLHRSGEVYSWK